MFQLLELRNNSNLALAVQNLTYYRIILSTKPKIAKRQKQKQEQKENFAIGSRSVKEKCKPASVEKRTDI